MSFSPVVLGSGYAGWLMLNRTAERQMEVMSQTSEIQADDAYFRENIGKVSSAEDLVNDHRLLKISLSAFGLEDDINNKAFIQRVLEDGTLAEDALANKLSDKRYAEFSAAFGFDLGVSRVGLSDFSDSILSAYKTKSFEVAVGEVDDAMRLALNAKNELGKIAESSSSVDTKWFRILGSSPLREVIETAFGLPSNFSSVDLDVQLSTVKEQADDLLGSSDPAVFLESDTVEKTIRLFTARQALQNTTYSSSGSIALTLLGG